MPLPEVVFFNRRSEQVLSFFGIFRLNSFHTSFYQNFVCILKLKLILRLYLGISLFKFVLYFSKIYIALNPKELKSIAYFNKIDTNSNNLRKPKDLLHDRCAKLHSYNPWKLDLI